MIEVDSILINSYGNAKQVKKVYEFDMLRKQLHVIMCFKSLHVSCLAQVSSFPNAVD